MFEAVARVLTGSFERAPWGWGVFVLLIAGFVRLRPIMARLAMAREQSLLAARAEDNAELRERVGALEAKLETERARHEAERALDRHRLNNALQCLDALFLMFETAPEKASEVITRVKAMRAEQMKAEAIEKAAIHAAAINKSGGGE